MLFEEFNQKSGKVEMTIERSDKWKNSFYINS